MHLNSIDYGSGGYVVRAHNKTRTAYCGHHLFTAHCIINLMGCRNAFELDLAVLVLN